jgi:glycosyltransferase involved in cell wall biosynthesis
MMYKIAIFSPDQHILYDLKSLDQKGVGGGVTVRVRIAHALANLGHQVSLFVNCPTEKTLEGVEYHPYTQLQELETDIFIASTSGGALDLSGLAGRKINAQVRILLAHGVIQPKGLEEFPFDWIYSPSNFLCEKITNQWKVKSNKIFVIPHGIEEKLFASGIDNKTNRDEYSMIYAGHPSKGLDSAIAVLRFLRQNEPRFTLNVFGGYQLWGEDLPLNIDEPGLKFHGLIGQRDLASKMQRAGFSLNLQDREEPFGMVVTDSMRAGCIVLANPVGAYPELIQNGCNGFLVQGDHNSQSTRENTAQLILELLQHPDYADYIRRNAVSSPLSWETIVRAMEGHWNWTLDQNHADVNPNSIGYCPDCGSGVLPLADGIHCLTCGHYNRYTAQL